jgi:hypothetical protein
MGMPDFLIVGAAKAGTISLYHYLSQHPDVYMCPVNESNFFALENADWNSEYRGPVDRFYIDQHCVKTLGAYQDLFAGATPGQVLGECSPLYLFSATAAARIRHHIPKAKIIVILRQPVDRAFSNYQHLRRGGIEPITEFREAIQAEPSRRAQGWGPWPFWYYAEMGFFARQLQNYFGLFGRDQVFVRLYEDLQQNATGLLKEIYEFIGVDHRFTPDVSTRHNIGGAPRLEWLHRLLVKPNPGKRLAKKFVPDTLRHRLRNGISDWNTDKGPLNPDVRAELNQMYRDDILMLQELINRDLSHWL